MARNKTRQKLDYNMPGAAHNYYENPDYSQRYSRKNTTKKSTRKNQKAKLYEPKTAEVSKENMGKAMGRKLLDWGNQANEALSVGDPRGTTNTLNKAAQNTQQATNQVGENVQKSMTNLEKNTNVGSTARQIANDVLQPIREAGQGVQEGNYHPASKWGPAQLNELIKSYTDTGLEAAGQVARGAHWLLTGEGSGETKGVVEENGEQSQKKKQTAQEGQQNQGQQNQKQQSKGILDRAKIVERKGEPDLITNRSQAAREQGPTQEQLTETQDVVNALSQRIRSQLGQDQEGQNQEGQNQQQQQGFSPPSVAGRDYRKTFGTAINPNWSVEDKLRAAAWNRDQGHMGQKEYEQYAASLQRQKEQEGEMAKQRLRGEQQEDIQEMQGEQKEELQRMKGRQNLKTALISSMVEEGNEEGQAGLQNLDDSQVLDLYQNIRERLQNSPEATSGKVSNEKLDEMAFDQMKNLITYAAQQNNLLSTPPPNKQ